MTPAARKEAIQTARHWLSRKPVYFDTETTGISPHDVIVEISVVDRDGSVLVDSLVKPVGKISRAAMAVHGITGEMVQTAPRWETVWQQVAEVFAGRVVGIYNADFDLRMLRQSHQKNWIQWRPPEGTEFFCIMKLYAQFYGQWNSHRGSYRWQSLDAARGQCGLSLQNTHRAQDDTQLTRAILEYMANQEI
jgi:DNA polymerase-3 subunit epsilon